MNTCGLEECSSSCHQPGVQRSYCAPLRCYCGGCPAFLPVVRGPWSMGLAELEARRLALDALSRARVANAKPITQAPPIVAELRAQLGVLTEAQLGPARHRAQRERAHRTA